MCLDFYSEIDFYTRILFLDKYFVTWSKRNFVIYYIYISYVSLDFYSERINFEDSVLFLDKYFVTWSKRNFVIYYIYIYFLRVWIFIQK